MEISRFPGGPWGQNAFLITHGAEAVVVDPGGDPAPILSALRHDQITLTGILNTHGHFDHIGGVSALISATGAPLYISGREVPILRSAKMYQYIYRLPGTIAVPTSFIDLDTVPQPMSLAGLTVRGLGTPGHTPGGYCFLIGTHLFSGDTLLASTRETTALPGGDRRALLRSIRELSELPRQTVVHPGHGSDLSLQDALDRLELGVQEEPQ